MWFVDTETYRLVENPRNPKGEDLEYGILSHRWFEQDEEVTFEDMKSAILPRHKKGFRKIEGCCHKAKSDHLDFVWIDTCCINKDSSAELSEAINSMYRWYQQAKICYAYLSDVQAVDSYRLRESLEKSKWFKRGWTLQELIAPKTMLFYDCNWHVLDHQVFR
jgi:hypothetical protein